MTDARRKAKIYYARVDELWTKEQKFQYLDRLQSAVNVKWQEITPDEKHTWLTTGLEGEFNSFLAIATREAKTSNLLDSEVIFKNYGRGVATCRDTWAYNFNKDALTTNIKTSIETYNEVVQKWDHYLKNLNNAKPNQTVDDFLIYDETRISWSRDLKLDLKRGKLTEFSENKIRSSLYRPFTKTNLFFDRVFNEEVYVFPSIFPTPETESENQVVGIGGYGRKAFSVSASDLIPDLNFYADPQQSFPFYVYNEDSTNRRENITDWALMQFRTHYSDDTISKWDIFHYIYAILHHPHYRQRYAANLKRELPCIPLVPYIGEGAQPTPFNDKPADLFWLLAKAGARLAEIHVHYEDQPEYPLKEIENPDEPLNLRVEKMRLSKDKTQIKYNDFLTLTGIPPETFRYRLGNRSALDWIIDQYQVKTDKRSGITNDPNQLENEGYIVSLIKKVITVSLETVAIVEGLPNIGLPKDSE